MDQYASVSRKAVATVIKSYSTSFGLANHLLDKQTAVYISDIYALVRIADEIVDTYTGPDKAALLNALEEEVYRALDGGFSANIVVHAFIATARQFAIGRELIEPFFESMRMDVEPSTHFSKEQYEQYIYGSAEVIGLMCLKVFIAADDRYETLQPAARALGAAFQKVNFVRDLADDYDRLHRFYFPDVTYESFDDAARDNILLDIRTDLEVAKKGCRDLPRSSQYAVALALRYFALLTDHLARTPANTIKQQRVRVADGRKLALYAGMYLKRMGRVRAL